MSALPREEAKTYLNKRIATLEGILEHIDEHQTEQLQNPEVPRLAEAIFNHSLVHLRAELQWTRDLLEKIEAGMYT
jgi:hypothetical protein